MEQQQPRRPREHMRRRNARLPWVSPDAPSHWWSAPEPAARRPARQPHPMPSPPKAQAAAGKEPDVVIIVDSVLSSEPAPPGEDEGISVGLGVWWRNLRARLRRDGWRGSLAYALKSTRLHLLTAFIGLLLCAWLGVALVQIATHLSIFHGGSGARKSGGAGQVIMSLTPTHPPAPTATPTPPAQTELDGVITIQNLDNQNPFDGGIQVSANNGRWICRNAPLPNSVWQVHLDPGAMVSLPCIIPVSTPSSLPPHTFRVAVPGANNQGLALVDNPAPFVGASYMPTPGS